MKKLMMAVAIVCAAAFAQAASVSWTIGYIEGKGADGNGWSGSALDGASITAQLIVSANADLSSPITTFDTDSTTGADSGYMFGYSTSADMASDTIYYAQVIITDGDSKLTSNIYTIEAGSANGDLAEPAFAFAGEAFNIGGSLDSTYGAFNASGWAVPEPTSGLLLLLGMACLALKRKNA